MLRVCSRLTTTSFEAALQGTDADTKQPGPDPTDPEGAKGTAQNRQCALGHSMRGTGKT